MNIYLLSQPDTFDSCVVCAQTEDDARHIPDLEASWCSPADVSVRYLGIAAPHTPKGVLCASYNAG